LKYPRPTVDIIIEVSPGEVVLIERLNPPYGWALPGGFVEYGETLEQAARREAKEEVGVDLEALQQFHTYSEPERDPRGHTISTVFIAKASGELKAGSDAKRLKIFSLTQLPEKLAFDHKQILKDYLRYFQKRNGKS
jgi:8-oxo-dGTP diphosphatase